MTPGNILNNFDQGLAFNAGLLLVFSGQVASLATSLSYLSVNSVYCKVTNKGQVKKIEIKIIKINR